MKEKIAQIQKQADADLESAKSVKDVEGLRVKYLGKKGFVQSLMHKMRHLTKEERPIFGKLVNDLKLHLSLSLDRLREDLLSQEESVRLKEEELDITLPGIRSCLGRKHVISKILQQVIDVWVELGFSVQYSPDIESDYYNFESLNFSPNHPARDMQDTFYIDKDVLLRTHTTAMQGRIMQACKPPIRVICPGKCYRNESITARSHVLFHQVDALYIDEGVTFADLFATLKDFMRRFFGEDVQARFRASYFPFVEPGLEMDVSCLICSGKACSVCKHTGWLEILGAGMVHPEVLKNGGLDPEKYTGYALGMGIERLVMLKYGIQDIRLFMENDLRFLEQF